MRSAEQKFRQKQNLDHSRGMAVYHREPIDRSQPAKLLQDASRQQIPQDSLYSNRDLLDILQSQDTDQLLSASDLMMRTTSDHATYDPAAQKVGQGLMPGPSQAMPSSQYPSDSPLHLSVSSAHLSVSDTVPTFPSLPGTATWGHTGQPGLTLRPHATAMQPSAAYPTQRPPSSQSPINPHYAGISPLMPSSNTSAGHSTNPQSELSRLQSLDAPQSHATIQSTFNSAMLSSLISNVQFDAPGTPLSSGARAPPSTLSLPPLPTSIRSAPPSSFSSQRAPDASPRGHADPALSSLAHFVDSTRGSRTAVASVAMLAAEAAFALHGMHAQACVHLRLHPQHVHICPPDDGCASPSSAAGLGGGFRVHLSGPSTAHGMLLPAPVGAPGFTAPEVVAASEDVPTPAAPPADVFSLAVLTATLLIATLDRAAPVDVDAADTASLTRRLQALLDSGRIDWNLAYILESAWVEDPNLRPTAMQVARACAWVAYMHVSPGAAAMMDDSADDTAAGGRADGASAADRLSDQLEQASVASQASAHVADAATGAPQWLVDYIARRSRAAAMAQAVPRSSDVPAMVAAAAGARARSALGVLKRPGWAARGATASHTSSGGTPSGTPTGTPREGGSLGATLRRRAARSKRLREGAFGPAVLQDILMATLKTGDPGEAPSSSGGGSRRNRGPAQVGRRSMSRGTPRGRGRGRRDGAEGHSDRPSMKSAGVNKHRAPRSPSPSCAPSFSFSGAAEILTVADFVRLSPGASSHRLSRPSTPRSTPRSTRPPSPSPEVSSAVTPPLSDPGPSGRPAVGLAEMALGGRAPGPPLQRAEAGLYIANTLQGSDAVWRGRP